jgi:hypothetical protein
MRAYNDHGAEIAQHFAVRIATVRFRNLGSGALATVTTDSRAYGIATRSFTRQCAGQCNSWAKDSEPYSESKQKRYGWD